jgi:RimJ/RimL family protein N-acetyltransferase
MPPSGHKAQAKRSKLSPHEPQRAEREDLAALLGSASPVKVESGSRLCTTRLVLRPLRASDQQAWVHLVRDSRADLDAFAPLHEPGQSDEALFERQVLLTTEGERTGASWRRVAVLNDGSLIGCFNINSIRRGLAMEGDVNWWLGTAY